jgi:hypothetical protein
MAVRASRCEKCKINFKTTREASAHFKKAPSHRTEQQQRKYLSNRRDVTKARRRKRGLPTVPIRRRRSAARVESTMKFCTHCGLRRKPSHHFCGSCGEKIA